MRLTLALISVFAFLHAASAASDERILKAPPDFVAEEIYSGDESDGSWSAMTIDPKGRLIISPQGDEPLLRVVLSGDGSVAKIEKLAAPVTSAMGLLFAFDSFYVTGKGPLGFGLYRLRDTKDADVFDEVTFLHGFGANGGKEHGAHGLALGPDNKIYLVQGNHVPPPTDAVPDSPYRNYAEDQLLPSANYGVSGGDKAQAPGGLVLRMDANASQVEIFAGGLRNAYDLAFDARGKLFAFDSDTEASWGLPWYVPTRILHIVAGGDYGFREGTGKWPDYYPDTLPAVVNIGLGCPTGVKFGTASNFPAKYRRALFALDWTFGRILAVHLEQRGASFSGSFETFIQGRPLNVTDLEFGQDGAMYFVTGGRSTRSALYRVRYTGGVEPIDDHRHVEPPAPSLGSDDRFLRHAARMELESKPAANWKAKALADEEPRAALTSLLALARVGTNSDRASVLKCVAQWWPKLKDESLKLDALRVGSLALSRHGQPYPATENELLSSLDASYPAKSQVMNRELAQTLIALTAPGVVARTMERLDQAKTFEEQLHYVFHLRHQRDGWSSEDRERYFAWFTHSHPSETHSPEMLHWFEDLHLHYADGGSHIAYLTNIRAEAAESLSDAERRKFAAPLEASIAPATQPIEVKPRNVVRTWTADDLLPLMQNLSLDRSAEEGREAFTVAKCVDCHRYANDGRAVGPDLTTVAYKLGARELIESLIEPSKVVSDQYQSVIVELTNGEIHTGLLVRKGKAQGVVSITPSSGPSVDFPMDLVHNVTPSPVSLMPTGLLNTLTEAEILDLLSYLGYDSR